MRHPWPRRCVRAWRAVPSLALLLALAALLVTGPARAAEQEANNGQDPTRPLTRVDLRYKYQNLVGDPEQHILTLRADKPIVLAPTWQLALRADLPVVYNNVPSLDNRGGDWEGGLSDVLVQGLLIKAFDQRNAMAVGAQLIFPTASQDQFGTGKYQIVPTAAYRLALPEISPGSFGALLVRYAVDYAGDDERADIGELAIAPILNVNLPDRWFVTLFPGDAIKYNAETGKWWVPFDVMVGRLLVPRVVGSVQVTVPIVKDYHLFDFAVEARLGFFFQ